MVAMVVDIKVVELIFQRKHTWAQYHLLVKGVLARESCTSTWLVSAATGCEKKNGSLHNGASDHKIEYTRTYFSIYKVTSLASRGTLKHQKLGEITYPFHIWVFFFS